VNTDSQLPSESQRSGWRDCFEHVIGERRLSTEEIQLLANVWHHGFLCGILHEEDRKKEPEQ